MLPDLNSEKLVTNLNNIKGINFVLVQNLFLNMGSEYSKYIEAKELFQYKVDKDEILAASP